LEKDQSSHLEPVLRYAIFHSKTVNCQIMVKAQIFTILKILSCNSSKEKPWDNLKYCSFKMSYC